MNAFRDLSGTGVVLNRSNQSGFKVQLNTVRLELHWRRARRSDPTRRCFFLPAVPPIPPVEPDGQIIQSFVENPTLEIA